jgi:hypothetical protein
MSKKSVELAISDTFALTGVEIFSSGKWNGDDYSEADLDAIVQSFNEVGSQLKPYVKLGHGAKQSLLREDELPAAGWITALRRNGKKLVADINGIPKKIYELMKNGGYRRVSSEIYWNLKMGDKTYPYALKAIAFLGGTTPAVQTLDDLIALYDGSAPAHAYETEAAVKSYELENTQMDDLKKAQEAASRMWVHVPVSTDEEIISLKAELEAKTVEAKTFSDEITTIKSELEASKAEVVEVKAKAEASEIKLAEYSDKAMKAEIDAEIAKLVEDKKIMPSQKESAFALIMGVRKSQAKAYSADGTDKLMADVITEFFKNASAVHINTAPVSETGADSHLDIADEAKKYSVENKVSYKDALVAVEKSRKAKA